MNTFLLMIINPVEAFREIKIARKFPTMGLVIVLLLSLINLILMIPITEKVTLLTTSAIQITESQKDILNQVAHKMRYIQVVGSELIYVIMLFFYALILYILSYVAKEKLKYINAFQLIIYSYFIVTIGDIVNTVFLYVHGIDSITNIYEISRLGVNLFTSVEQAGPILYSLLSYLTPFQFLFVVLLNIGLKVFTEMSYAKSLFISLLFWFITILIPILSIYQTQSGMEKIGII